MPIYSISNYTRYSTEDIACLLDKIEKNIPVRVSTEDIQRRRYFSLGLLYEYDSMLHIMYSKKDEAMISIEQYGSVALFKICKTDRFYDSPMEALSLSACDIETIPDSIERTIVRELIELYQMPFSRRDVVYKKCLNDMTPIRILSKDIERLTPEVKKTLYQNKRETKALQRVAASITHMNKCMKSINRDITKISSNDLSPEGLSLFNHIKTVAVETQKLKDSLVYIHNK